MLVCRGCTPVPWSHRESPRGHGLACILGVVFINCAVAGFVQLYLPQQVDGSGFIVLLFRKRCLVCTPILRFHRESPLGATVSELGGDVLRDRISGACPCVPPYRWPLTLKPLSVRGRVLPCLYGASLFRAVTLHSAGYSVYLSSPPPVTTLGWEAVACLCAVRGACLVTTYRITTCGTPGARPSVPPYRRPLILEPLSASSICDRPSCSSRVAVDGHSSCSTHSPCFTAAGYDPTACQVCRTWLGEFRRFPTGTRLAPPPLVALRSVWARIRRAASKRGDASVHWADPALAAELGLSRTRTTSAGTTASGEATRPSSPCPEREVPVPGAVLSEASGESVPSPLHSSPSPPPSPSRGSSPRRSSPHKRRSSSSVHKRSRTSRNPKRSHRKQSGRERSRVKRSRHTRSVSRASSAYSLTSPSTSPSPSPTRRRHHRSRRSDPSRSGHVLSDGTRFNLRAEIRAEVKEALLALLSDFKASLAPQVSSALPSGPIQGWRRRDDVQIKFATSDEGVTIFKYRLKPWSASEPTPSTTKISTTSTLDAVRAMLVNRLLNPSQAHSLNTAYGVAMVEFGPTAFFPESGQKSLDVASMLEKAVDHRKISARRPNPSSVTVIPPKAKADPRLAKMLWNGGVKPSLPHQVREPDQKLAATEAQAKADLAHRLSTVGLVSVLRDALQSLADNFHSTSPDQLSDILKMMATVVEGTASMMAFDFPHLARTLAEARMEARKSAAKGVPEAVKRGVLRAESLSSGLFDTEATDKVFASVPTIIQLPPPPQYKNGYYGTPTSGIQPSALLKLTEEIFKVVSKRNIHLSARHVRGGRQHLGGRTLTLQGEVCRVATKTTGVEVPDGEIWHTGSGSLRLPGHSPTTSVPLVLPEDPSGRPRRLHGGLEQVELYLPLPTPSNQDPPPRRTDPSGLLGPSPPSGTSVGDTTLVLSTQGVVPKPAIPGGSLPSGHGHLPTPLVTEVTRLEFLKAGLARRFLPSAVETMLKAHRPSSIKQYDSCWRRYQAFLRRGRVLQVSEKVVMDFLAWLGTATNRAPA
ncbi:hypothetical protein E2C01_025852 [Portunus trituberculatus]|uniref:Uncharacterized protein n=1 Tax=Portunus trituberculatus TaxID=210409 RepID=A0A5B7EGL7_PORTR|nr:hypothetical protein [Portunus trituberculatus]